MKKTIFAVLIGAALCLVAASASAQSIVWNGSFSTNPADGANWSNGVGVSSTDTAEIGNSPQSPDFQGLTFFWGKMNLFFANHLGDTGGGGKLNLLGADDSQLFSAGDNHVSTIDVDINATKNIQSNGTHSLIFNGDVTARKVEAFGGSVSTYNGVVRQTDEFMSIGGGSKIVINNEFYWMNNNHGINNHPVVELGAGAKFFRPDTNTPDPDDSVPGLDVWNVYDGAIVRILADNALGNGETDIWSRNTTNTFDLNGFNQNVEFFGIGDAPAALNVDFGATSGANKLVWDAAHGMNGPGGYNILHFEQGLDTLEFGQYGPDPYGDGGNWQNPSRLARVTINGAAYSATDPGVPYWNTIATPDLNDDPARTIAVYHVPEPASLALVAMGAVGLAARRKRS